MRKSIIISLLALAIILAACESNGTTKQYDPYTGSNGLAMKFEKNNPPDEVYEGQTFNIVINTENQGAESIRDGVMLLGYEEEVVEPQEPQQTFSSYGRAEVKDKGEKKMINFRMKAKKLDPQVEVIESLFSVTACYTYRTKFFKEVCMDTDPLKTRTGEKNCAAKDITSSGQGAPVTISKVEVEMTPHEDEGKIKPSFKLTIENNAGGTVFNVNAIQDVCSSLEIKKEDINTIRVVEARVGQDYYLDCKPKREGYDIGYVKLREDESIIRCTYEDGIDINTPPFTSPLYIELEYGYSETITTSALIRKEI